MVEFRGHKQRRPNAHASKCNSSSNGTMKLRVFGRIIEQLISLVKNIKKLQPFFQINLGEMGVLGSTGVLQVVGSAEVKKHEKNTQDNHDSITIVRIGSAGGTSEPWIFLIK
jgi:hypothetical protein